MNPTIHFNKLISSFQSAAMLHNEGSPPNYKLSQIRASSLNCHVNQIKGYIKATLYRII